MIDVSRATASGKSAGHKTALDHGFLKLVGALLLTFLMPLALFELAGFSLLDEVRLSIYAGIAAAVLIGHYFFRRLTIFPGVRSSSYVLPVFSATFLGVIMIFFFLRVDYSRLFFLASYATCVTWYFFCYLVSTRVRRRRLAVVPLGAARKVNRMPSIDWLWLRDAGAEVPPCDGIVVDLRADLSDDWERFIAESAIAGVPVYHVKQIEESVTGRVDIEHLSENSFGSLIPGLVYIKIKQAIDVLSALIVGIILLPILGVIALAVKLDSPGPAFFWQMRYGYRGHPFLVYKFRTMRPEPLDDDARARAITRHDDDRVTRLGRVLRRNRIDELPQILNILRGQMSWIGPRPEACALSEWYEKEIPFYRYRHIVRPGITGWAQVNQGHVAEIEDVHDKLQYDFYYIKYFSPWLDMLIVFRTIKTMLTGFGSK